MKLYYNAASPFSRKVRVFIREAGLEQRVDEIVTAVSRTKVNAAFSDINPLVKIPALVTDDGLPLFDSPVICEYLDHLHDGARLFAPPSELRWRQLRLQAICDEIQDSGNFYRFETVDRPEPLHRKDWASSLLRKMHGGLDLLERDVDILARGVTIASISAACTLAWLDFRYSHDDWRRGRPRLAGWFADFAGRASMQATPPSPPPKL